MDPSLGARLRAHRERQQISLGAVSATTKIKLFMLEGLERDDVTQWPEGIYRRAYVRAYARAVGLDPETVVLEFLEVHPDPIVAQPPEETELETPPWPAEIRRLVTSAFAAVPRRRPKPELDVTEDALPPAASSTRLDPTPQPTRESPVTPLADANPSVPGRPEPTLTDAATICMRLGRARDRRSIVAILGEVAEALGALGVTVWSWDSHAAVLRPLFAYGYTDAAISRMARVRADADNGIAEAFRSADARIISGESGSTGAVVLPLLAHGDCFGVLAVELRAGDEQREAVRTFGAAVAAPFVTLLGIGSVAEAVNA